MNSEIDNLRYNWHDLLIRKEIIMKFTFMILLSSVLLGCASILESLKTEDSLPEDNFIKIYQISEQAALLIAYDELSKYVHDNELIIAIDGPDRGYAIQFRMGYRKLDRSEFSIIVAPASGVSLNGMDIKGYYFQFTGVSYPKRPSKIIASIEQRMEKEGNPIIVKQIQSSSNK